MRALCVGRHPYLSDHLCRFFGKLGLAVTPAVGIAGALAEARRSRPEIVLADYDLLTTAPLAAWEHDELLSRVPVVAVSLTRRPSDSSLLDANGIAGFLYLPTLDADTALKVLGALRPPVSATFSMRALQRTSDIATH